MSCLLFFIFLNFLFFFLYEKKIIQIAVLVLIGYTISIHNNILIAIKFRSDIYGILGIPRIANFFFNKLSIIK